MSAGGTRSQLALELTADQLLAATVAPTRHRKWSRNAPYPPRVVTLDDLLGPDLSLAASSPPSRSSIPLVSSSPSSFIRLSPSPSYAHAPVLQALRRSRSPETRPRSEAVGAQRRLVRHRASTPAFRSSTTPISTAQIRVTADEVLRTGLPLRALQAAKARALDSQVVVPASVQSVPPATSTNARSPSQTIVLTAEQLFASDGAHSGSGPRLLTRRSHRNLPRMLTAADLAGPNMSTSTRPASAGRNASQDSPNSSPRIPPWTTDAAHAAGTRAQRANSDLDTANAARGRGSRSGHVQRSSSHGSTRTLPRYTKEPGESEVIIVRGAEEFEDDVPMDVMTPVVEDGPSFANSLADPVPVPPASPQCDNDWHMSASPPLPSAFLLPPSAYLSSAELEAQTPYAEEAPSYETAMMSSPDLPLPVSSAENPSQAASTTAAPLHSPSSDLASPRSSPIVIATTNTETPSGVGASHHHVPCPGSPRRQFRFMSLLNGSSSSVTRSRSHTESDASQAHAHRSLHHSPSVLDLLSRSWSDHHHREAA